MQITSLLLYASSVTLLASAAPTSDADTCQSRFPATHEAIGKFCQKTDIVAPSPYAGTGAYTKDKLRQLYIHGYKCKPSMWVPQKYCFSQFYEICANSDKYGEGTRFYGTNGCQEWTISYLADNFISI